MSRQVQFTKESIIRVSIEILRAEGPEALSARAICKAMGCSVSPLFRAYSNMEEILSDVHRAAEEIFSDYVGDVCDYTPAFKEFGMRLVSFSKAEPNLFHYLFLAKESRCRLADEKARECLVQVEEAFALTNEQSALLYRQMWPFACGIANICNRNPERYTDELIGEMLSTQFQSLLMLIKSGRAVDNIKPQLNED